MFRLALFTSLVGILSLSLCQFVNDKHINDLEKAFSSQDNGMLSITPHQLFNNSFMLEHVGVYMDEIFHVRQALHFILWQNFSFYDPMLTTPPGAYFFGMFYCYVVKSLGFLPDISPATVQPISTTPDVSATTSSEAVQFFQSYLKHLRFSNVVLHAVSIPLLLKIFQQIHQRSSLNVTLATLHSFFLPLLYFFIFVYYTDISATFFILCMWYLYQRFLCISHQDLFCRRGSVLGILRGIFAFTWISLAGCFAILTRQTSIVWLFYLCAHYSLVDSAHAATILSTDQEDGWQQHFIILVMQRIVALISPLMVAVGMVIWVIFINEGAIVLGDKTHHQPVIHFAQLPLCFFFVFIFSPAQCLRTSLQFLQGCRGRRILWRWFLLFGVGLVFAWAMSKGLLVHPYLLADNRHLIFYFYQRILSSMWKRHIVTILALPGLLHTLRACVPTLWKPFSPLKMEFVGVSILDFIILTFCITVCCVPQKLIEFRYFVVPALIIAWKQENDAPSEDDPRVTETESGPKKVSANRCLIFDVLVVVGCNVAVIAVFTWKPFIAPDQTLAWFMW